MKTDFPDSIRNSLQEKQKEAYDELVYIRAKLLEAYTTAVRKSGQDPEDKDFARINTKINEWIEKMTLRRDFVPESLNMEALFSEINQWRDSL